jgi:Sulfotransferase domain
MALRIVGAGLGRTGTHSLKLALERLLGAPCYHMMEVFGRPDDIPVWHAAVNGEQPDWTTFLADYAATVDWPAAAFWRELSSAYPDAPVLLSTRSSADAWWKSANDTIFQISQREIPADPDDPFAGQMRMALDMLVNTFTPRWTDEAEAKRAYEQHNADVRATIDPARLIDWHPGDGWEPICAALSVPVPDEPFPHVNTTSDFRAMIGLDATPD